MKKKILALFLATAMVAGMSITAYAGEINVSATGGETVVEEAVYSVYASNGSNVTVDSVNDTRMDTAVRVDGYSTVTVNGDINAISNWSITGVSEFRATVTVGGDINVTSTADGYADGASVTQGQLEVGRNVKAIAESGDATGVNVSADSRANIAGNVTAEAGEDATGVETYGDSIVVIDRDVNVKGGSACGIFESDSKVYIKGNLTVEGKEDAVGVFAGSSSVAVIDGVLTVNGGQAWAGLTDEDNENAALYVYQVVEKPTKSRSDGPEWNQELKVRYIIKTDEGLTTTADTFSDSDLNVSGFYAYEDTELIVSNNGGTIYGIKNADSSIDIKITANGDGTWTIIVPKGGGVHLQAILEIADIVTNSETNNETKSSSHSSEKNAVSASTAIVSDNSKIDTLPVGTKVNVLNVGTITVLADSVNIVSPVCGSFNKAMLTRLSHLSKKTVITFSYEGHTYQFVIPANVDLTQFANEEGYAGYLYLSEMFGRYEEINGVPVLVIPAKAAGMQAVEE